MCILFIHTICRNSIWLFIIDFFFINISDKETIKKYFKTQKISRIKSFPLKFEMIYLWNIFTQSSWANITSIILLIWHNDSDISCQLSWDLWYYKNLFFSLFTIFEKKKIFTAPRKFKKKKNEINSLDFWNALKLPPAGLEPATPRLEVWCSIHWATRAKLKNPKH